ncbi:MAG: TonB-dependent receptor [Acidobacteriota bacterium]|nr:TonB-dependent receptor [Acidobacteriota bacterium]
MPFVFGAIVRRLLILLLVVGVSTSLGFAQSGNSGVIRGMVTDPSGAVIPGATVRLTNALSGMDRTSTADATGQFEFSNVPFHPYTITVSAAGFASLHKDIDLESALGIEVKLILQISGAATTVTVESSGDLIEDDPTFHTDVDRDSFIKVPLESQSSSLSSLVTVSTPGVSADSNGMFHGLGDHASNSFSVDGQPITDQQSRTFSNQLPSNVIQSMEVISGAPPAEYGDKTSLVIVATTRSGQGVTKPTGSISSSYGSFGSASGSIDLSYGGKNWGNFFELDGLNTGRFLDPPEFKVFHAKGNQQNVFDRVDYSFNAADSLHSNLNYSRSWFQTPNSYDNLNVQNVVSGGTSANPVFANVGNADQRSKIGTFNFAPTWTHVFNQYAVLNTGVYARKDQYHYYPSPNPLADLGPANMQTSSIEQARSLFNTGIHSDLTYANGNQNIKIGAMYEHTFLREHDRIGVVDSTLNAPCLDASGNPIPGYSDTSQCAATGLFANPGYLPVLAPYDLTRRGADYAYYGHADIKEIASYIEDQIRVGNWNLNLGLRGDVYNGLTSAWQAEPRLGIAYSIKRTGTVLRLSYARTLETPFNENLVLSSEGCSNAVLSPLLNCSPGVSTVEQPGFRNEFHAGFQQAVSRYVMLNGEYIWKYTHNAFDFSVLGNTPITFPIDWHNSKIPGYAINIDVPTIHGFSAYAVMSSVAARFFPPQVAGAGATVGKSGLPFRIDHDEKFNQTTHVQYQFGKTGPWMSWNWRYDSGQVAGSAPFATNSTSPVDLSNLTNDQQFEAGITCNGVKATLTSGFSSCAPSSLGSTLISIPAPGTQNPDKNPARIAPRNLFDLSLGQQNIFRKERYKIDLDITAVNITNKYALYNFLSTFSGTHYVTPRALTAKVTLNF